MTAQRSSYLGIYATRTPHEVRPAGWLPGTVVVLTMIAVGLLVLAPDVAAGLADWASGAISGLR